MAQRRTVTPTEKIKEEEQPFTEQEQKTTEPDLPREWIAIAAYYIWKNDGEAEGRDLNYWERARTELTQLWNDGRLSEPRTEDK